MSSELIAIIAAATACAWVWGAEFHELLRAPRDNARDVARRLGAAGLSALVLTVWLNLETHTRTEVYLLRIGLVAVAVHAAAVWASVRWLRGAAVLRGARVLAALVGFWSVLHYAMNPKLGALVAGP